MDMAVANLFKHKIRFELVNEHPDNEEHRFYSVGRQYSSRKIENAKSIGLRSWVDFYIYRLHEFFTHVVSTMTEECPFPIDHIEIKASIRLEDEEYDIIEEHNLLGYVLKEPMASISQFTKCSELSYYRFPEDWWDEPFYIDVKAYSYICLETYRKLATNNICVLV